MTIETFFLKGSKNGKAKKNTHKRIGNRQFDGNNRQGCKSRVREHVSPEAQAEANKAGLAAVIEAKAVIGDSNIMTVMENSDDAIELQHQIAEQLEAEEQVGDEQGEEGPETEQARLDDEQVEEQIEDQD